jgi:hypothetical protein
MKQTARLFDEIEELLARVRGVLSNLHDDLSNTIHEPPEVTYCANSLRTAQEGVQRLEDAVYAAGSYLGPEIHQKMMICASTARDGWKAYNRAHQAQPDSEEFHDCRSEGNAKVEEFYDQLADLTARLRHLRFLPLP